jgi:hypothetical protein
LRTLKSSATKPREGIKVVLDFPGTATAVTTAEREEVGMVRDPEDAMPATAHAEGLIPSLPALAAVPITYTPQKAHILKSHSFITSFDPATDMPPTCAICSSLVDITSSSSTGSGTSDGNGNATSLFTVCPHPSCSSISHLRCLAKRFVDEEVDDAPISTQEIVLPVQGTCPSCHGSLEWRDIAKEASLRARGKREVEMMIKRWEREKRLKENGGKAKGKGKGKLTAFQAAMESESEREMEDDEEELDRILDEMDDDEDDDELDVPRDDSRFLESPEKGDGRGPKMRSSSFASLDNFDAGRVKMMKGPAAGRRVVEDGDWNDAIEVD